MSVRISAVCVALLVACAGPSAAQTVKLEFLSGRVNLSAQNVPARAILAEWARLGGTQIVNGDRMAGAPLTLELQGVPERQALDIILRSVAGYMLTARAADATGASSFDRLMILPTSSAPRPGGSVATFTPPPPAPQFVQSADEFPGNPTLNAPGVRIINGQPQPGAPMPEPFVPEPVAAQDSTSPPSQAPSNPFMTLPGSSRAGEITPVPQQDNRPGAPR